MHVRMNMLAGDPARLDEANRYIEGTVRPHVEALHGNRGLACLTNTDLGVCVVASYWDTHDAMTASEQAVEVSRKEVTQLVGGTVAVEHYEVPVFVRQSRPRSGAGVRLARFECPPGSMDTLIEEFRNAGVPALMDIPGLCSAQMMADRTTGRCIAITAWENMDALAASRSATAGLRADAVARTHAQFRSVEEYRLVFSSVREGDTRSLIERDVELWNARDHESWLAGWDLDRMALEAPGGIRMTGREAVEAIWSTWIEAFPDNQLEIMGIHADDRGGVHEGRFSGTHTGTLRGLAADEIPATGRTVEARFAGVYEFEEGKITSWHLYFDRADMLSQLGIGAGKAPSGMLSTDHEPVTDRPRTRPGTLGAPGRPAERGAGHCRLACCGGRAARGRESGLPPLRHPAPPVPGHKAWMPLSCSNSDMNEASTPYR